MDFQNKDFNRDIPRQYKEVQRELARMGESYLEYFGPLTLVTVPSELGEDEGRLIGMRRRLDNKKIKKGYNRVKASKPSYVFSNCNSDFA